eukprot:10777_1
MDSNVKHLGYDALTMSSIIFGITNSSKQELLSCISCMDHDHLQTLLLGFLSQINHSFAKDLIHRHWDNQEAKDIECTSTIKRYFADNNRLQLASSNNETDCKLIQMIPSSIGAYVMSFHTMKDVLKHSLICRAFYKYCQQPMAKEHLIIDHAFAKALYNDEVDYTKFFNIKSLAVTYVFCDSKIEHHAHVGFESKYYSAIAYIIGKSPDLRTLCYNLKYKRFKYVLYENCVGNPSSGTVGHLFTWLNKVQSHHNTHCRLSRFAPAPSVFKSVTKFVYTPSQPYITNHWGWQYTWRDQRDLFKCFFPNLKSITIPRTKLYETPHAWMRAGYRLGDRDLEWNLFSTNSFGDRLEAIDVNMVPRYTRTHTRHHELAHVNIGHHPLQYFGFFANLQSLALKIPIFEECHTYYSVLWTQPDDRMYCANMKRLKLEFEWTDVNQFEGRTNHNIPNNYPQVMDNICAFVLSQCPNVIHLALNTNGIMNNESDHNFNCLIAHYGKLETLMTDSLSALTARNTRFLSLRKLVVTSNNKIYLSNDHNSSNNEGNINFDLFPNLQCLKWNYNHNNIDKQRLDLNGNIIQFLQYISANKHRISRLTSISLSHCPSPQKHEGKWYRFPNVKKSSAKICKLITSLTTNDGIRCIELHSVSFKPKDIEYLSFWFHDPFGSFRVEPLSKRIKYVICLKH